MQKEIYRMFNYPGDCREVTNWVYVCLIANYQLETETTDYSCKILAMRMVYKLSLIQLDDAREMLEKHALYIV